MITLISKDGETFQAEKNMMEQCKTLKFAFEDVGDEDSFPVAVNGDILKMIIEFAKMNQEGGISQESLDLDQDTIFSLIMDANYLDFPELLDACATKIASLIKGKTPKEIRETFGIEEE